MSLILDALKRSDAERREARAVVLPPVEGDRGARSGGRRVLTAVAALVAAAAIGYAAWRGWPAKVTEERVETPAPVETPTTAAPAGPQAEEIPPALPTGTDAASTDARLTEPGPRPEPEAVGGPGQERVRDPLPIQPPETSPVVPQAAPSETQSAASDDPLPAVESVPPAAPVLTDLTEPEEAAVSPEQGVGNLPMLSQLPAADRAAIGELTLNIHVFDAEPDKRFVLINLRRYQEGGEPGPSLRVERISPEGVVISFQGRPFLLPAQGR